ncbi:glycosyltransferase [Salipaludibacillus sp. LMS25]|uniref:glycosyltransferase n=1 Tax=Salipaludibacillus sp. LMS25 TaxID=2924031 RepID=UPI0020D07096|nr:glycosyltransferase [Salipaludibacillus sp. LMS25]UTR16167.1 glycosyltransferase [Salipaludibacillus sp. LMS25]
MKKVCLIINSLRGGGAERVAVTVANNLVQEGYDVDFLVLNLHEAIYQNKLNKKINLTNLQKTNTRAAFLALFMFIKRNDITTFLVFNHQIVSMLVIIRYLMINKKFKIISRSINTLTSKRKLEKSFWHKYIVFNIVRLLYRKSDCIIAQSSKMAEDLRINFRISEKALFTINNPINEEAYCYKKQDTSDEKKIIFIGRLVQQKRIHDLIKAFSLMEYRFPNVKLYIFGEGPLLNDLKQLVVKSKLIDKVLFMGFTQNVYKEIASAELTALSSYYEGFPNVLVESLAVGVPVVSYDCASGPSEIIEHGRNGFLVENGNVEMLSASFVKALNKTWDVNQIVLSSRKYSSKTIIKKYIDVIESV